VGFFELRLNHKLTGGIKISPLAIFLGWHESFGKTKGLDVLDAQLDQVFGAARDA